MAGWITRRALPGVINMDLGRWISRVPTMVIGKIGNPWEAASLKAPFLKGLSFPVMLREPSAKKRMHYDQQKHFAESDIVTSFSTHLTHRSVSIVLP